MSHILSYENRDQIRELVEKDLSTQYKIKLLRYKKVKKPKREPGEPGWNSLFGVPLEVCPCVNVAKNFNMPVATFVVKATSLIRDHVGVPGIFRTNGSTKRQNLIVQTYEATGHRKSIENIKDYQLRKADSDETYLNYDLLTQDLCCLLKKFFRSLPESIFTERVETALIKVIVSFDSSESLMTNVHLDQIFKLLILLPDKNISLLCYFMRFLNFVCRDPGNMMDHSSLSTVIFPSIVFGTDSSNSKLSTGSNLSQSLESHRLLVKILIQHSSSIGLVCEGSKPDLLTSSVHFKENPETTFTQSEKIIVYFRPITTTDDNSNRRYRRVSSSSKLNIDNFYRTTTNIFKDPFKYLFGCNSGKKDAKNKDSSLITPSKKGTRNTSRAISTTLTRSLIQTDTGDFNQTRRSPLKFSLSQSFK